MHINFPPAHSPSADLSAVSDQHLEWLHLLVCRQVDLQYFVEGACRPDTRARYLRLNDELHHRAHIPVKVPERVTVQCHDGVSC